MATVGLHAPSGLAAPWGALGRAAPPPKVSMNYRSAGKPAWPSCIETCGLSDKASYFSMTPSQKKVVALASPTCSAAAFGNFHSINRTQSQPNLGSCGSSVVSSAGSVYDGRTMENSKSSLLSPGHRGVSNVPRAVIKMRPRQAGAEMRKEIEEYTYSPQGDDRRKHEKNFSDFFDGKIPRQPIKEPGTMHIVNQICNWTDTRTEVARRNFEARSCRRTSPSSTTPRIRQVPNSARSGSETARCRYKSEMSSRIFPNNEDQGADDNASVHSVSLMGSARAQSCQPRSSQQPDCTRGKIFACGKSFTSRGRGSAVYLEPESPVRKSYAESVVPRTRAQSARPLTSRTTWEEARCRRLAALSSDKESLFGRHW